MRSVPGKTAPPGLGWAAVLCVGPLASGVGNGGAMPGVKISPPITVADKRSARHKAALGAKVLFMIFPSGKANQRPDSLAYVVRTYNSTISKRTYYMMYPET